MLITATTMSKGIGGEFVAGLAVAAFLLLTILLNAWHYRQDGRFTIIPGGLGGGGSNQGWYGRGLRSLWIFIAVRAVVIVAAVLFALTHVHKTG